MRVLQVRVLNTAKGEQEKERECMFVREREGRREGERKRERFVLRSSQGHSTRKNGRGEGSQKIKNIRKKVLG